MKKFLVSMSGGVDSTVSAYLSKEKTSIITGVMFNLLTSNTKTSCCSIKDIIDFRYTCKKLGNPAYVINAKNLFKKVIIDPSIIAYNKGLTPNPCIKCNYFIKFGWLRNIANKIGTQSVTGHYVRIVSYKGYLTLGRSIDLSKDQSYFLYNVTPRSIQSFLFPLGFLYKFEVREIAKKYFLDIDKKKDSQELCFSDKLKKKKIKGMVKKINGEIIGYHNSINSFTIGQKYNSSIFNEKNMYVLKIDSKKNEIIISYKFGLIVKKIIIHMINEIVPKKKWPDILYIQIRAKGKTEKANWFYNKEKKYIVISYLKPTYSVAKGQSAVFYDKNILLGGGIILDTK